MLNGLLFLLGMYRRDEFKDDLFQKYVRQEITADEFCDILRERRKLVSDDEMAGDELCYYDVPLSEHPENRVDLHNLHVGDAIQKLREKVQLGRAKNFKNLYVITGRKNHVNLTLKTAVQEFAQQQCFYNYICKANPECVVLTIRPMTLRTKIVLFVLFNVAIFFVAKLVQRFTK
jgi:hypothetical protein